MTEVLLFSVAAAGDTELGEGGSDSLILCDVR